MIVLCSCLAWGFVFLALVRSFQVIDQAKRYVHHLHQIPCAQCRYFTGDYRLKCPVNPCSALSEAAIGCRDFESISPVMNQPEAVLLTQENYVKEPDLWATELGLN